jgi:hypothetical protein
VPVVACSLGFFVALGLKWRKINTGKPNKDGGQGSEGVSQKDANKGSTA